MALLKLLPEFVSQHWDEIRYGIEESLPPVVGESDEKMNNILLSILDGTLDAWLSYKKMEEGVRPEAVMLTCQTFDPNSETSQMLIYCVYGYEKIDKQSWTEGYVALSKYAKSKKCSRIVTYTKIPYLIEMAKEYGANCDYTFISWPLI